MRTSGIAMKQREIHELATHGNYENEPIRGRLEETHISWVILTKSFAFKIKKPLRLSFLDFSTLSLRKDNCERELVLNSRFSSIYLAVLPVRVLNGRWYLGGTAGSVVDYAVQMKRMLTAKRMDNLLRQGRVKQGDMDSLADTIATFHAKAQKIDTTFNLPKARATFNDIGAARNTIAEKLGPDYAIFLDHAMEWSNAFLDAHAERIQQRVTMGYQRDVHGDLHSRNIFLYRNPVIFDCIEFNDAYRQIDLLYEIAFLCMDLEAFGEPQLAAHFLNAYSSRITCFENKEDEELFMYFKCLRANIRAKVQAIKAGQSSDQQEIDAAIEKSRKYLELMKSYILNKKA